MKIRNVDEKWDWCFGHSDLDYSKDLRAISLDIQMRLKEWYEDCFFNLAQGIPWNVRLGAHNQQDLLDQDVQNTIRSVEGVLDIFNFSSIVVDRRYTCQVEVYTIFSNNTIWINFTGD